MNNWVYCASLLRARKNKFISLDYLKKLADTDSLSTFLKGLKETVYGEFLDENNIQHYDTLLEKHLSRTYADLIPIIPDTMQITLEKSLYDLNNIKFIFKSKFITTKFEYKYLNEYGNYPPEDLYVFIGKKQYYKFPALLACALYQAENDYLEFGNKQNIDFILDNALYKTKFQYFSSRNDYKNIAHFFKILIEIENYKNLLRAKNMGINDEVYEKIILSNSISGGLFFVSLYKDNLANVINTFLATSLGQSFSEVLSAANNKINFSLFEKKMDECLVDKLKELSYVTIGPDALFEYIFLKKLEIKNLKLLIIGKLNKLSALEIKNRLREVI